MVKSAYLLSKRPEFFGEFRDYLMQLKYSKCGEADNSIKLTADDGAYFLFYDRLDGGIFEECEIPRSAKSQGYRYGFLVECRSEVIFCDIVRSSPPGLDLLVCDSDGKLFKPSELSPETITL